MLILSLFLVLIFSLLFEMEPANFKKSCSWIYEKHDQNFINLANVFEFIG